MGRKNVLRVELDFVKSVGSPKWSSDEQIESENSAETNALL